MKLIYRYLSLLAVSLFASTLFSCSKEYLGEVVNNDSQSLDEEKNHSIRFSIVSRNSKVSAKEAVEVAQKRDKHFLRSLAQRSLKSCFTVFSKDGQPALYVMNYSPRGYSIISATRKYDPIVSYSDIGYIPQDYTKNSMVKELIQYYAGVVRTASLLPDSLTRLSRLQWEMLGNKRESEFRSIRYDEEMYHKISSAISKYETQGYRVYRYRDIMGDYDTQSGVYLPFLKKIGDDYLLSENIRQQINEQIRLLASKVYDISDHVLILLKDYEDKEEQKPLLSSSWGQGEFPWSNDALEAYLKSDHYNMYIPNYYPVGCVAVATAQIMRYHKQPSNLQWSDMPDDKPTKTTAKFLYEVAKGVNTTFAKNGSSSNISMAQSYLEKNGYAVQMIDGVNLSNEIQIRNALKGRNPLYARGFSDKDNGGHAFVLDGYSKRDLKYEIKVLALPDAPESYLKKESLSCIYTNTLYQGSSLHYHFNLGWSGIATGNYDINDVVGFKQHKKYLIIKPSK